MVKIIIININSTTLPNSSIIYILPMYPSVTAPVLPIVCTPVSLGAYTPASPDVSIPAISPSVSSINSYGFRNSVKHPLDVTVCTT